MALPSSLESAQAGDASSTPAMSSAGIRRRSTLNMNPSPCRKARSRARWNLFVLSGQRRLLDSAVGNLGFAILAIEAPDRGVEVERGAAQLVHRLDQARALVDLVDDAGHELKIGGVAGQEIADRIRERVDDLSRAVANVGRAEERDHDVGAFLDAPDRERLSEILFVL